MRGKAPGRPRAAVLAAALAGIAALLAGCSSRTQVSASGNAPAQYSHVYVTIQGIWFNTGAAATAEDSGWVKFSVSPAVTVDLVAQNGGNLASLVTGLKLAPGTYSQIRLIPVDPGSSLTPSAQTAGALYNAEADYVDSSGQTQQLPLEMLNPDKGIGIQASLKVPIGALSRAATTTPQATTPGASVAATSTASTATTGSTSQTTLAQFTVYFDGARDLVPFTYNASGPATPVCPRNCGVLLNAHPGAWDMSTAGGISGQLTLTNLTAISGSPDIQATAETVSADGTRHEVVISTPVSASGSFLLYPLASSNSSPAYYDVVIHGPGIATIIVKAVQVVLGNSTTAGSTATTGTTTGGTTTDVSANTVSLGTITPRSATSFSASLSTAAGSPGLPAGAVVNFCQTLGGSGEVPYVIARAPVDPSGRMLTAARTLAAETVDSGTYVSSGSTLTLVSAAPAEGKGHYTVGASSPDYDDGPLTTQVRAPSSGSSASFSLAPLSLAAGVSAGQLTVAVTRASGSDATGGTLLVSHEGALVASAPLDSVLGSGSGQITLSTLPAGTDHALYYLTVRSWNAGGAVSRQFLPALIDMRSSAVASASVTVN
ncbi:MAG: DUF4382 domain-containing protein [Proteobacteria bacterium]|nr:DUF4382 domain-containing protein [Pseudomonadota bacterium]